MCPTPRARWARWVRTSRAPNMPYVQAMQPHVSLYDPVQVNEALERVAKGLPRYRVVLVSDENDPVLKTAQH